MISVIIPTYNRAHLIGQAIDSVLAQSYSNWELWVADNGSTDKTADVVRPYLLDRRVHYLPLPASGLAAVARNAALRFATGEWVAFLDSDDRWLPHKLERQAVIFSGRPEVGLVCSNARVLEHGIEEPVRLYLGDGQGRSGRVLQALLQDNFVITSTTVIRRSLLERVGTFSEDRWFRAEDYDLWLRIAAVAEVLYIPEALAIYRDEPASSVRSQQSLVSYWQSMLFIHQRLRSHLKEWGLQDASTEELIERLADTYRGHTIYACWAEARYLEAAKRLAQFFWQRPTSAFKLSGKAALKGLPFAIKEGIRGYASVRISPNQGQVVKLHLGCGEVYLPGYINIDFPPTHQTVQARPKADLYADIRQLAYRPESVDEIRLHHVFEHFDRPTALALLCQWYLWLKPDGLLIIETPDLQASLVLLALPWYSYEQKQVILRHLFGSHEAHWAVHFDGWYAEKFRRVLSGLGFRDLRFAWGQWKMTRNVTVRARKARSLDLETLRAAASNILRDSLVDSSPSEEKLLTLWRQRVDEILDG